MRVQSITTRGFVRWFLAILQIFCGYRALEFCGHAVAEPSVETIVIALALLPFAAGIGLIVHLRTGRILTLIAQGVQLIGWSSPVFTWVMLFGVSSRIVSIGIPSDVPGESYFGVTANVHLGEVAAVAVGHPHPDYEGYVLSINFLALVIMVTVWLMYREKKGIEQSVGD